MSGLNNIINLKLVGYFTIGFLATAYETPEIKALKYKYKARALRPQSRNFHRQFQTINRLQDRQYGKKFHVDIW